MKLKKIIVVVSAAALVLGCVPQAMAEEIGAVVEKNTVMVEEYSPLAENADYKYDELDDGTLSITKYIGAGGDVVIPAQIDGKIVTKIGSYAFSGCSSLTSVRIPDSVTSIGSPSFSACSSLIEIDIGTENENYSSIDGVLYNKNCTKLLEYPGGKKGGFIVPNSVIVIDYNAFDYCSFLTSIEIPDSVTFIGRPTFAACFSLIEISVGSENANYSSIDGVLYNKNCTQLLACPGGKKGDFIVPNSVTEIGYRAFEYCSSLTYIEIPDSVTEIDGHAFFRCSSLTSLVIPNSVTAIGGNAFSDCSSLTSVEIPDSVTKIGNSAFSYCSSLTSVVIPKSVTVIGESTFLYCSSLTSVEIPNSVTKIDGFAFDYCSSLTSIVIPDSITNIGSFAFSDCSSLTSVVIPESVTKIGYAAFDNCDPNLTIYSYKDTFAEEYANQNEINFIVLEPKTIYDAETEITVEGVVIPDTTLLIEKSEANDNEIKYDITLKDSSGNPVQPIESVTVKIPLPSGWDENKCKVYRSEKDRTFTDMEAEYINGYMVFSTDHFSEYVVTTNELAPKGILGDINNDTKVTIADARMLLQAASGSRELTEEQRAVADINGDGKITIVDARWLLQVASGSREL